MLRAEGWSWGSVRMQTINAMTPRQARAARAVKGLSVRELAAASRVPASSIQRIEKGQASLDLRVRLQAWYQAEGVQFYFSGGHRGVGWEEL